MKVDLHDVFCGRAGATFFAANGRIRRLIKELEIDRFYIAGNMLNAPTLREANDIDIFPSVKLKEKDVKEAVKSIRGMKLVASTKNAFTITVDGVVVQLCNYGHQWDTLEDLVESFDYAHIQAGVEFDWSDDEERKTRCYYTDDFINSHAIGSGWFTGSEYPLSSLIRMLKYYKRGLIDDRKMLYSVFSVLVSIINRGFEDYDDYKDQLDSVDLGILPDDLNDLSEDNLLLKLFELLDRSGA